MCLLLAACCASCLTSCGQRYVVIPSDDVPVKLWAGEVVPERLDGWYAVSPGALRKLYRKARSSAPSPVPLEEE